MGEHVYVEETSSCEAFVTLRAGERFLSGMCMHVLFEVTSLCAREATQNAAERSFP